MKLRTELAFILLVLGLVLGLCFEARGQVCQPGMPCYRGPQPVQQPVQRARPPQREYQQSEPTAADVKITTLLGNSQASGSGTAIAHHNNGTVILTNHHVIEGGYDWRVCVEGGCYPAKLLGSDSQADVALLWIPAHVQVVRVADAVPSGVVAQFRAFDGGEHFRVWQGRILGFQYDSYLADTYSVGGNSGGGVYVNGSLVGVLWGNRDGRLAFAGVGPIRKLLGRVGVGIAAPFPEKIVEAPQPAPPQQPATPPAQCQECDCNAKIAKLVDLQADLVIQVQKLEASIDVRLDKQEADIEWLRKNQEGNTQEIVNLKQTVSNFPKPDTAKLELRINQLEAQLAELRATTPVTWDIVPRKE